MSRLEDSTREKWSHFVSGKLAETNERNTIVPVSSYSSKAMSSSEDDDADFRDINFPQETALQQVRNQPIWFNVFGYQLNVVFAKTKCIILLIASILNLCEEIKLSIQLLAYYFKLVDLWHLVYGPLKLLIHVVEIPAVLFFLFVLFHTNCFYLARCRIWWIIFKKFQIYSDYQMQQMTDNLHDPYGFTEDDFNDNDDSR